MTKKLHLMFARKSLIKSPLLTSQLLARRLALPIILLFSTITFAEETIDSIEPEPLKVYDIEIIIFKNKSVPKGQELNLPSPSPTRTELTLDLLNPENIEINAEMGFFNLQPEELRLQDITQHIKRSSRYDLLIHTGWRQPGLDKENSMAIWIKGGENFGYGYSSIDHSEPVPVEPPPAELEQVNLEPVELTTEDTPLSDTLQAQPEKDIGGLFELEGQIIISLSRYLHTQVNLVLRKPATVRNLIESSENQSNENSIETIDGNRLLNYGLNEKRRMRSKKLHYLDHPEFAMLVLITPYEAPEEEELVTTEETSSLPEDVPVAQDSE
ncbi:MAG: hypothetical protein HOM14_19600 [Gammaproteobacteria bacterium]|jgi:hypothetical protein|nr:hypothetical protein [Gammaproteobacteria bacterium]MBT3721874.1 hypothetical protein [Gammaproteobacteria bacterium]MBT4075529.1 hypothetical protein [Gammaproteobacteria bacterium]MBT4196921.1 hypothetical protein [Gammaproteobacteria bacterium]MBT4451363.1 hypothetical protein [Gammaproteobacteria bacterium]